MVVRAQPEALVLVERPALRGEAEPLEQEEARGDELRRQARLGLQNSLHFSSHLVE